MLLRLSMLLRLYLSPLLLLWLSMLLRLYLSPLLLLWLSMLLWLSLSSLLLLWLSMLLRLRLCPLLLLWLSVLLRLRLCSLLLLWLSMLLRLYLSPLLLLWLSVLLRLRLGSLLLLWLSMLLRLRLGSLLLLWLGVLLLLRLSPLLLLLLWPWLGSGASRNHRCDRSACRDRLRRCKFSRTPVIDRGKLLAVLCCRLLVLHLRGHRRNALLTQCGPFRRQWLASDASRAVVAGTVHRGIVDAAVIHVNVGDVHTVDRTVIVEAISAPVAALIAHPAVAEAIVDAAVVADILAPETVVEAIHACGESPISRRPQEAHLRWHRPYAGHPEVALRSVAPISGRPQIAIAGDRRLRIFRQRWRRLLCLKHGLAVAGILVVAVGLVIGVVLILCNLLHRGGWRSLLRRRGLLIVLLRRLTCWLLLIISSSRLGAVYGRQIVCSRCILRLIGLILGAGVRGVVLTASCNTEGQCDRCGCQNDKR